MKYKCVFIIGPESSGSMLIARMLAEVLGIERYGKWNGVGWVDKGKHKVCHRSLPFNIPPQYPDITKWISNNEQDYEIYFVITTRDITISEVSRIKRFPKTMEQVQKESKKAKDSITELLSSDEKCFVFSYEAFMFLKLAYLRRLYKFLGIDSEFIPDIVDGNKRRLTGR